MRALVTGGAGFIGSHLVDLLLAEGHDTVVVDDFSTGTWENLDGILDVNRRPVISAGIEDFARQFCDAGAPLGFDVVYHLAAQTSVPSSLADPLRDMRINVGGTVAALEVARRAGARFVLVSSAATFGDAKRQPVSSLTPCQPISPYGQSKLAAEGYVELYQRLHGLDAVTVVLPNVYGPRQRTGVIPTFIRLMLDGGRPTVYASPHVDGWSCVRDFVHVGDVARFLLTVGTRQASGPLPRLLLGTGVGTSMMELCGMVASEVGFSGPAVVTGEARPGDIDRMVFFAPRGAGFYPSHLRPLADGLRDTVAWWVRQRETRNATPGNG